MRISEVLKSPFRIITWEETIIIRGYTINCIPPLNQTHQPSLHHFSISLTMMKKYQILIAIMLASQLLDAQARGFTHRSKGAGDGFTWYPSVIHSRIHCFILPEEERILWSYFICIRLTLNFSVKRGLVRSLLLSTILPSR